MTTHTAALDVRDMVVVHTAMLREFRLLPSAIRRVAPGNTGAAAVIAAHARFMLDMLHHHHHGEDRLLWPVLRVTASPAEMQLIQNGERQHEDLSSHLFEAERTLADWESAPSDDTADNAAGALEALYGGLSAHLDFEERELLPIAATHMSAAEWGEIGKDGAASVKRKDMAFVIGMFMYEGDHAIVQRMLLHAPLPVRVLMPRLGPRAYAARAERVYGTRTP